MSCFCFSDEDFVDLEKKFSPSILNTTVYIISMALQVSTFAVNYRVSLFCEGGRRGCDRMFVGYTTTCAISAYHH
jgi:magnesium-transporting ATPase (P-type)